MQGLREVLAGQVAPQLGALQAACSGMEAKLWLPMLAGHCTACVVLAQDCRGSWLLHLILTFLLAFGGALASALLIMVRRRPSCRLNLTALGCD